MKSTKSTRKLMTISIESGLIAEAVETGKLLHIQGQSRVIQRALSEFILKYKDKSQVAPSTVQFVPPALPGFKLTYEVCLYLEKRMGKRVWEGIFIHSNTGERLIYPNETGKEIQKIMGLYETCEEMLEDK